MSRAGKKTSRKSNVKRVPTNLTLDIGLKKWAAEYAEAHRDEFNGSVSELLTQLLKREKADAERKAAALGARSKPTPTMMAIILITAGFATVVVLLTAAALYASARAQQAKDILWED